MSALRREAYLPEPRRIMVRFGGKPYFDGQGWRCTECNGLFRRGECQTCGATPSGNRSWAARYTRGGISNAQAALHLDELRTYVR